MVIPARPSRDNSNPWHAIDEWGDAFEKDALRDLLTVRASMTGALRARCRGDFRLRVVAESDTDLDAYQHGELAAGSGRVREVLMGCGDARWLFAQTLIPEATLAAHPWLARLGERPLGDALFSRDDVERGDFLFARIEPATPLGERVVGETAWRGPASLWARRSYFFVAGLPLLVNEVFLPGLFES